MAIRTFLMATAAAVLAPAMLAQAPQKPDPHADPAVEQAIIVKYLHLKPGQKVAEIIGGKLTEALAQGVGPTGRVYVFEPDELVKAEAKALDGAKAMAAAHPNIEIITGPINQMKLPSGLDLVFMRQNYHDLYDKFMGPADVPAFNKAVFHALKVNGEFIVIDHSDQVQAPLSDTETLHRIDEAIVKGDMKRAGFFMTGESRELGNLADPRTKSVFDPSIRGKTDQFMIRFLRPATPGPGQKPG